MITGFEKETIKLSEKEKEIERILIEHFQSVNAKGEHNARNNEEFVNKLKGLGYKTSQVRIRKIMTDLRLNDKVLGLCSSRHGYYVAETQQELFTTLVSLRDRIESQSATYKALHRQYGKLFCQPKTEVKEFNREDLTLIKRRKERDDKDND